MITTIKITGETKNRLTSLDLSEKGKTYDILINDLITFYQKSNKKYTKDYKKWEESIKVHQNAMINYNKESKEYNKQKETWIKLLKWAKSNGFKK